MLQSAECMIQDSLTATKKVILETCFHDPDTFLYAGCPVISLWIERVTLFKS